jgi:hypothetical protein
MDAYADSSFLVSCYVFDANSVAAGQWLAQTGPRLCFTALHALEVRNAFNLGVFRGALSGADATAAWRNLNQDLRAGRLVGPSVRWTTALRLAARLSEQHSSALGTRSLDVLHVAVAKVLRAPTFASFDTRQRGLATAVGLQVSP